MRAMALVLVLALDFFLFLSSSSEEKESSLSRIIGVVYRSRNLDHLGFLARFSLAACSFYFESVRLDECKGCRKCLGLRERDSGVFGCFFGFGCCR